MSDFANPLTDPNYKIFLQWAEEEKGIEFPVTSEEMEHLLFVFATKVRPDLNLSVEWRSSIAYRSS